jgi:hypothetical protein
MDYLEEEEEDPEMIIEEKEDEENNAEETMITGLEVEKDDLVQEKENIDSDLELLETTPSVLMTPKKKRAVKIREQLDDGFLRRSKRVSQKLGGFRDAESASKHKEGKSGKDKNEPKNSKKIKGSKSIKK